MDFSVSQQSRRETVAARAPGNDNGARLQSHADMAHLTTWHENASRKETAKGFNFMNDTEMEQTAFEWFAEAHPHEAYETWPERFWEFFQKKAPGMSREQMERLLKEP